MFQFGFLKAFPSNGLPGEGTASTENVLKSITKPIDNKVVAYFKFCLHKGTGGIVAASDS